jgi:hypothetical protein
MVLDSKVEPAQKFANTSDAVERLTLCVLSMFFYEKPARLVETTVKHSFSKRFPFGKRFYKKRPDDM